MPTKSKKPKPQTSRSSQQESRDQIARFKETARKLGADTSPGALDRAFGKIEPKRAVPRTPARSIKDA